MTTEAPAETYIEEPSNLTLFRRTGNLARPKGLTQLLDFQQTCYERAMSVKTDHEDFAALARAFCLLEERIRIRRGIPLPGQLRPDLQPMKGARVKRGKGSPMLDLPAAAQSFMESAAAKGEQLDDDQAPEVNPSESKEPKPPTPAAKRRAEASR